MRGVAKTVNHKNPKKTLASEPSACSLQAHEKKQTQGASPRNHEAN